MIQASVGFQCPDDVKAGQQGVRTPRTASGGRALVSASPVTFTLIALNVAVYLVETATRNLTVSYGNLALAQDGGQLIGIAQGQYYRLVTAAFLHAGLFHLASNMFALWIIGPQLEVAVGRGRYLALYLLAAVGGSTLSYLVSPPGTLGVGASGAIFGLFGAFYVVVRRVGGETGPILALLAINLVITFAVPIIDWRAHVGGLVVGAVVAGVYVYTPAGPRRGVLQAGGCLAVGVVLAAAVALRTAALTA